MTPDDPIDASVRAHLDAEAAGVDPQSVLAGVKHRQLARAARAHRWVRWTVAGATALAACLLVGLYLTGNPVSPPRELSAAELLQAAKTVHESTATDRCYTVTADWDLKPTVPRAGVMSARSATVWTRGDQFVVLSAVEDGPPWAWGQDTDGRVWLAPNRRPAVVFDKSELNDPLARVCEVMSLRLASTLGDVLEKYDLFRKESAPGEPVRIEASLRQKVFPGVRLRRVELELDPDTKAVRSATLYRMVNGTEGKIAFTLTETATKPDDFYTLKGHTDPRAVVLDGKPLPSPPAVDRDKLRDKLLKWQKGK